MAPGPNPPRGPACPLGRPPAQWARGAPGHPHRVRGSGENSRPRGDNRGVRGAEPPCLERLYSDFSSQTGRRLAMVEKVPTVRALTQEDVDEAWAKVKQAKLRADLAEARAAEAKESVRGSRAFLKTSLAWLETSENDRKMAEADAKAAEADAKVAELGLRTNALKVLVVDGGSRSAVWKGLGALAVKSPAQFDFLARLARTPGLEVPSNELGGKRAKEHRYRLIRSLVQAGGDKAELEKAIEPTALGYVLRLPMELVDFLPAPRG